ncbi:hypothetical protein HRbin01_01737 [archaeon HR01]|nr:hypothetical protein HRbin01_01737 [archaeon HR01]
METEVLSIRVRRSLKNEAEKLGLNVRDVVESALEQAVSEARKKQLEDAVDRLLHLMENVSPETWVKEVREWRNLR